jgi:hypothetical protein
METSRGIKFDHVSSSYIDADGALNIEFKKRNGQTGDLGNDKKTGEGNTRRLGLAVAIPHP